MMGRILQGCVLGAVIILVPLAGRLEMLCEAHIWILVGLGVAATVSQPAYNPFAVGKGGIDRGTGAQIVWSVYLTQLLAILEAAYIRFPESVAWNLTAWVGLAVALLGLGLRTWAVRTLGASFTMHVAVGEAQAVICHGPYRIVRHPSYLGALMTYAATAVFFHAWISFGVALVVLPVAFGRRIRVEEAALREGLGDAYVAYSARVKRLIPYVW
jgi:protein-S-isoprenylcysteine O-methyltransferase